MADFKHIKVKRDPNQQDLKIDDICFVELLVVTVKRLEPKKKLKEYHTKL